ncbi:MAG: hypothetical protein HC913_10615 [Microscillaceae bacterium]|nr:hypothetical protein [Microscillaceae bacterium]
MNWGYRVTILYLSFVAFMLTMVYMSFQYEVNLVAKDYYKQEMAYQKEIDKMKNVQALEGKVGLEYQKEGQMLRLSLPGGASDGEILFFGPAMAKRLSPGPANRRGRRAISTNGRTGGGPVAAQNQLAKRGQGLLCRAKNPG